MRLSFKKGARVTGLASVAKSRDDTAIKADGRWVGNIVLPGARTMGHDSDFSIRLIVDHTELPDWKWITLKVRFETEEAARAFITEKWEAIQAAHRLHPIDA